MKKKATYKRIAPKYKKAPMLAGKPFGVGVAYYGGMLHWLDRTGKMHHTQSFPDKDKVITSAGFIRIFGIEAYEKTLPKKKKKK